MRSKGDPLFAFVMAFEMRKWKYRNDAFWKTMRGLAGFVMPQMLPKTRCWSSDILV